MFILENPIDIINSIIEVSDVKKAIKAELKTVKSINVEKHTLNYVEKYLQIKELKQSLNLCELRKKKILNFFNNSNAMN